MPTQIDWSWIATTSSDLWMVVLSAALMYGALILFTRLGGLRSFSKLSSFDFAITVSFGTVFAAGILTDNPPLFRALFALGLIYALQFVVAWLRIHSDWASSFVDNSPILVMRDGSILDENLAEARVTKDDLRSKLRDANVLQWDQVRAVIVETTGDISVLHSSSEDDTPLDPTLLAGVRGVDAHPEP